MPPYKNTVLLHQKYVQENRSLKHIAREIKCSPQTVKTHLVEAGVPLRPQPFLRIPDGTGNKKIIDLNEHRVIQMILDYRRLGMSAEKIASALNQMGIPPKFKAKAWHYQTIHRIVRKHGLARVRLNR